MSQTASSKSRHRSRPVEPGAAAHRGAARAAFGCLVVLAVALGAGRFAFTPLLPLMLHAGVVDLREGGWLASANYAGYFVGAVSCAALRVDPARMIRVGLAATALLLLAMGATSSFALWMAIRFAAGVVSAWTFVFASQWGLRRLASLDAHGWSGVIYAGPGVGIVVTGVLVSVAGGYGARVGWLGFGVVSLLLAVCVWKVFDAAPHAFSAGPSAPSKQPVQAEHHNHPHIRRDAIRLILLYGIPGFGYIITATFLPVIARAALPGSHWPDLFWPMFGVAQIVGAICAARLPVRWDNRLLLAGSYVLQAVGIAIGIVAPTAAGFSCGSVLIGLPFTAITLFAMREARRLHGERAAGLMGYATAAYGIGQIAGPLIAAPVAAHTGSFSPALWLAAVALTTGAVALVLVTRGGRGASPREHTA